LNLTFHGSNRGSFQRGPDRPAFLDSSEKRLARILLILSRHRVEGAIRLGSREFGTYLRKRNRIAIASGAEESRLTLNRSHRAGSQRLRERSAFARNKDSSFCALNGLERLLQEKFPAGKRLKSLGGEKPCVNLVRYADDFVITSKSKELLEGEIKPLVEQFLQERGLELSPTKTVITHVEHGFDFLGQNVRRYPNGKLLIKPSKKNVGTFLKGIRRTIKEAHGMPAADLIGQLNPKIRGWANYHRHMVSKRAFGGVDRTIFSSLWQWARRRHPNKSPRWFKPKHFGRRKDRDCTFFGETCDDDGRPNKLWLFHAKSTPIKRHVKVKGEANPYDPTYETYFEEREGAHMLETFRGTRTLRYLWHEQRGLCTQCNTKITRITGWRLHYGVPRVRGGSTGATNCVLLHPECHDRVHRQRLPVSKPRLP
jgi:RNA-directed DNA polymerase